MKISTRYGLAGIAALAALSLVHWVRDWKLPPLPVRDYLLGVLPNFTAALAIIFVLLSIWSDQNQQADTAATRRAFLVTASITAVGLFAWEFFQKTSDRLIFDPHDLGATLVGIATAGLLFAALTPRTRRETDHPRFADDRTAPGR